MRKRVAGKLHGDAMSQERVLACALRLLDRGFFRIGGEEYAEQNGSFGLATLERRHVRIDGGVLIFEYDGKTGERQEHAVVDPGVERVATELKRRRGGSPSLLAYKDGRQWVDVRSDEINTFIKQVMGSEFSAKDFRTWHATVLAAVALGVAARPASPSGRKRAVARAVCEVAHHLRNTPAVCRASYIDPRVFDRYNEGATIAPTLERLAWAEQPDAPATQGTIEKAVLALLED